MKSSALMHPFGRRFRATAALIFGVLPFITPRLSAETHGMPPGAYLRTAAPTVTSLVRQVCSDKLVSKRYARLFGMRQDTISKVWSETHLERLKHEQICRVYYVHQNERLGYKIRRVRRGTIVFALSDGTPVLIQV